MLIAYVFFPLVGGGQALAMAGISYLSSTTEACDRVKHFVILEIIQIVSAPLGIFVGGLVVQNGYLSEFATRHGLLHNYHHVLMIAIVCKLLAHVYALCMPFLKRPHPTPENSPLLAVKKLETFDSIPEVNSEFHIIPSSNLTKFQKFQRNFKDIFVLKNVSESIGVCMKKRANRAHVFIWLLLVSMAIITMTNRSTSILMFQFVQKVFKWDAGTFSTVNSVLYLSTHLFGLLIATPIMTRGLQMSDSTLLIVGLISLMAQNFIRGSMISAAFFCTSYFFGSVTSITPVAIRTKLSKLCKPDELNRIFGILTTLETISPLIGVSIYSYLFNMTISYYPGLVFQVNCFFLLIPLSLSTYIGVQTLMFEEGTDNGQDSKLPLTLTDSGLDIEHGQHFDMSKEIQESSLTVPVIGTTSAKIRAIIQQFEDDQQKELWLSSDYSSASESFSISKVKNIQQNK